MFEDCKNVYRFSNRTGAVIISRVSIQTSKIISRTEKCNISTNTYTSVNAMLALKYNLVDISKYSIEFAIKMKFNFEKSTNISYRHKRKFPLFRSFDEKRKACCAS